MLGHKGETVKSVGKAAREELEEFLGRKVHLFLQVKVRPNWLDPRHERFTDFVGAQEGGMAWPRCELCNKQITDEHLLSEEHLRQLAIYGLGSAPLSVARALGKPPPVHQPDGRASPSLTTISHGWPIMGVAQSL